jgi:hypothetical protein
MENFEERLKNFYKGISNLIEKYPECKEEMHKERVYNHFEK